METEHNMFGAEFAVITKLYYGALTKRLQNLEIDRYHTLILYLGTVNANITQQALSKEFKIDKTVLVRILDYLAEKGYITRVVNPQDKRSSFVQLTNLATERLAEIKLAVESVNNIALAGLDNKQQKNLHILLHKVKSNLFDEPSIDFQLNYK